MRDLVQAEWKIFLVLLHRIVEFYNVLQEDEGDRVTRRLGMNGERWNKYKEKLLETSFGSLIDADQVDALYGEGDPSHSVHLFTFMEWCLTKGLDQFKDDNGKPIKHIGKHVQLRLIEISPYAMNREGIFQLIDVNGDRVLSMREFGVGLKAIGLEFTDSEVEIIYKVFDKDSTNKLT